MMHSAVLAPPSVSTWSASQSQPMLYNPYGLHSIRQSRIRTLNLTWAQALTQKIVCVSFWDETVSFNSSGQGHPSIISIYWGKQWCVRVLSQCWCTMFTQNTILDIVDILARGRLCFLCLWAEAYVCGGGSAQGCILHLLHSIQGAWVRQPRAFASRWALNEKTFLLQMKWQNKFDRLHFDIEACIFPFVPVCLCGRDHVSLYVCAPLYLCAPLSC